MWMWVGMKIGMRRNAEKLTDVALPGGSINSKFPLFISIFFPHEMVSVRPTKIW